MLLLQKRGLSLWYILISDSGTPQTCEPRLRLLVVWKKGRGLQRGSEEHVLSQEVQCSKCLHVIQSHGEKREDRRKKEVTFSLLPHDITFALPARKPHTRTHCVCLMEHFLPFLRHTSLAPCGMKGTHREEDCESLQGNEVQQWFRWGSKS